MMNGVTFFAMLSVIQLNFATATAGSSKRTTDATASLIAEIIDEYYILRSMPLLIYREHEQGQADLVNQVIQSLHHPRVVQLDTILIGYTAWFYGVFFCRDLSSFQRLGHLFTSERYDIVGYYTFVLIECGEDQVSEAFDVLWKLRLLRTVLVVVNEDQPQLFHYTPYSNLTCGRPMIHRIQQHTSTELFIHFLNDFYGCPLKLGTFETPPFVHFLSPDQEQDSAIVGFEGDLVSTLAGKLNFRLVIVTPPDNAQWGVPSSNGSTGLMKILQDATVDFGVGCLGIMPQRNEILQPGRAHYTSRVLFAIPEGHPYSPIEKLLRPYERTVWVVVVSQVTSIAFLILVLMFTSDKVRDFVYGAGNRTALLNLFTVVYSGGLHAFPRRNFARTLLVLWIVQCFVLRTVYQGLLFRYLQDKSTHSPVDTVEGIEQSALLYHINKNSDRFFQHNPDLMKRIRYIPPGNDSMGAAMDAVSSRKVRDGVVLVTLEHIAYHNKHRLENGFLRSTRDSLSGFPLVIYYPKRTFLVRVLNRVIGNIETAGLMSYWVRRYGNYHFIPAKFSMAGPKPLELQHVMGCFAFISVQLSISCLVFGLELLSSRVAWLRRALQFLVHR